VTSRHRRDLQPTDPDGLPPPELHDGATTTEHPPAEPFGNDDRNRSGQRSHGRCVEVVVVVVGDEHRVEVGQPGGNDPGRAETVKKAADSAGEDGIDEKGRAAEGPEKTGVTDPGEPGSIRDLVNELDGRGRRRRSSRSDTPHRQIADAVCGR
jgi:hypothetical protein